jgi:hypothetical protein
MRYALLAAALLVSRAQAASLPVYTSPGMGGNRQLILQNFDEFGGTMAGVIHDSVSTSGQTPTWQPLSGGNATFYLTNYDGAISLRLSPLTDRILTSAANFGFSFPNIAEWGSIRETSGPLTFRIVNYTTTMTDVNQGFWRIFVEGQSGATVATGDYVVGWSIPEPETDYLVTVLYGVGLLWAKECRGRSDV